MSASETLGPFQTSLTAATKWEHQGLSTLFFNRIEMEGWMDYWGEGCWRDRGERRGEERRGGEEMKRGRGSEEVKGRVECN